MDSANINIIKNFCSSKVLLWFTTHYQRYSRDWDLIKKYGNPSHPLWGYYKSDDPEILEKQIKAIKKMGVDVITPSVFATYEWTPKDISKDKVLPMFSTLLSNQKNNTRKLKYCIIFENYVGYQTFEELSYSISYAYKNLMNSDCYFKSKGKPFVLIFCDEKNWEVIEKLRREYKDLEIQQIAWSWKGSEGWLYVENYPQTLRKDWMPVSPGFDSSLEEVYQRDMVIKTKDTDPGIYGLFKRWVEDPNRSTEDIMKNPLFKALRENGKFYRDQLLRAVKNNPEYIFISGWNDWQYRNQVEPAEEYGFKYVDMTAEILNRKS